VNPFEAILRKYLRRENHTFFQFNNGGQPFITLDGSVTLTYEEADAIAKVLEEETK